jgi:hypothetical protein
MIDGPVITAITFGFAQRNERTYPLRAALPVSSATFVLGESHSVLSDLDHQIATLDDALSGSPETANKDALTPREAAQPQVLSMVATFAMHATAADLDSDLYDHLNHLLATVGFTPITDLSDHYRYRILDAIAAR